MSDIAALPTSAPSPSAAAHGRIAVASRPARDGSNYDKPDAEPRLSGRDVAETQGFQTVLTRKLATPKPLLAPSAETKSAPDFQTQAADLAELPQMLAALLPAKANAGGNDLPAGGNSLPVPALPDAAGDGEAPTDATTLALAGAMAAASQMPGTPTPAAPADAAKPAALPSHPGAIGMPLLARRPGENAAAQPQLAAGAPPLALPPLALMVPAVVPADASTLSANLAAAQQITMEASGQTPGQTAADLSLGRATRLRPVLTSAHSAAAAPTAYPLGAASSETLLVGSATSSPDDASAQELPTTLLSSASASTAHAPLAHPQALGGAATPQNSANPAAVAGGGADFAALVDRLVEARAAARSSASPQVVQASVPHGQFGQIGLRFEQGQDGLSVSMTSADPEFARSAQAALAAQPAVAAAPATSGSNDTGSSGPDRQNANPQAAGGGFAARGGEGGSFGQNGQPPRDQPMARDAGIARATPPTPATTSTPSARRQSGILA